MSNDLLEVWGLTGGIASGKSLAAKYFSEVGIPVVDADQVARELSQPGGAAHAAIVQRFGTDDRQRLREMVFSDPAARKDLEAILHPLIVTESQRRLLAIGSIGFAIYEAALLVETGRYRDFKGLIVVESPQEARLSRLTARDGCTPAMAAKMIAAQTGDQARRQAATHVLNNSGSPEELRTQVQDLVRRLGSLS